LERAAKEEEREEIADIDSYAEANTWNNNQQKPNEEIAKINSKL